MDKNTLITILGATVAIVIIILGSIAFITQKDKEEETLASSGTATITTAPDQVSIIVSIQTEANTAQEAKDVNSKKSSAV